MQNRQRNEHAKLWIFRKIGMVATCSTTDGNGSCHGLAPSFFEEMTRCRRQKHRRQWPGNHIGPSKFGKYHVYLPILRLFMSMRSRLMLRGWRQRQFPLTCTVEEMTRYRRQIHRRRWPGSMTRIDWNSAITQIYAYKIKQDLSKNISLLQGRRHYVAIAHVFFPSNVTCNGYCSHLISRRPCPPPTKREMHTLKSFLFYL